MKKIYVKPTIGKGCLLIDSTLLTTASIATGSDIGSGETVQGDARQGSFWDDSE